MRRIHCHRRALLGLCAVLAVPTAWSAAAAPAAPTTAAPDPLARTAQVLFQDANAFWSRQFAALGGHYPAPSLQLFSNRLDGACSLQESLSGPFYCPSGETVYIDEVFVREALMHTAGTDDAALALVIGHEVAHHVQNLLGTTALVEQARARSTPALSARTWATEELQADCYAALWMQSGVSSGQIRIGTDPSALLAGIAAVSREREAHVSAQQVMPDPVLTYGTAAQRLQWFQNGLHGNGLADCDTFSAESEGKL